MTKPTCAYDTERGWLTPEHLRDCDDGACRGCRPCGKDHCQLDGRCAEHVEHGPPVLAGDRAEGRDRMSEYDAEKDAADEWDPAFCRDCGWLDCECVKVGSLWRRNPPGREVVRVERVWTMGGEDLLRAHPVRGGRPLVTDPDTLREGYTECPIPPAVGRAQDGDA